MRAGTKALISATVRSARVMRLVRRSGQIGGSHEASHPDAGEVERGTKDVSGKGLQIPNDPQFDTKTDQGCERV